MIDDLRKAIQEIHETVHKTAVDVAVLKSKVESQDEKDKLRDRELKKIHTKANRAEGAVWAFGVLVTALGILAKYWKQL